MKTDIFLKLKEYEQKFFTAVHCNYIRFTSRELNAFNEIYKEHTGQALTPSQRTCPHCLLTAVKQIAAEYYKFKDSPQGKKIEKKLNEKDSGTGDSTTWE